MKKWLLALFIITLTAVTLPSKYISFVYAAHDTYYVSPSGNNSNNGSIIQPWLTLKYAMEAAQPGDTIILRGGSYTYENFEIINGGTSGNPITVKNYPGETPLFDNGLSFELFGADWWIIEGLEVSNNTGDYVIELTSNADHNIIRSLYIHDSASYGIAHQLGSYNRYEQNRFEHIVSSSFTGDDLHGIEILAGDNNTVKNNTFHNVSGDGIQLTYSCSYTLNNTLIENNAFSTSNDTEFPVPGCGENGVDIKCPKGGTVVKNNTFHGFRHARNNCASGADGEAIVIHQGAEKVTIDSNTFYDNNRHITALQSDDITIRNNVMYDTVESDTQWCYDTAINIYETSGPTGIFVYNNTIVNTRNFLCGYNSENIHFKNNLIYNSSSSTDTNMNSVVDAAYNGWFTVSNPLSRETDTTGTDPKFVNALSNNYRLLSSSKAIDTGFNLDIPIDFAGTTRPQGNRYDLGAFEYVFSQLENQNNSSPVLSDNVIFNNYNCTNSVPVGIPDLFQIDTSVNTATLYFTPVTENTDSYIIEYGEGKQADQY
ncbi:MAG TPA: right-handed parallel beta-helix repeat-containing protein, partial [Candidatus Woesebacteria bacterium]|nr:right-handed parallel beta-helix repeat-containing protein [Candidatus Woesebacteria bacterium]